MNSKIQELVKQSDWWKPLGLPSDWNEGDYVVDSVQLKKFTDSFLEQCIEILKQNDYHGEWLGEKLKEYFSESK